MWDIMKIQKPHDDSPWMCVGDMNQIFHVDEKKGEMLQIFEVFNNFKIRWIIVVWWSCKWRANALRGQTRDRGMI